MAAYLLDTRTALWYFNGDEKLSKTANEIIYNSSNPIYLSIVSAWELAIKIGLGKMGFTGKSAGFIRLAEDDDFTIIPIKTIHLSALETLPFIHRDPFDRLLIATAIAEGMTIITADENIVRYEVKHIW
jgi:PIN domain nuclease of toxin-antitoxin system